VSTLDRPHWVTQNRQIRATPTVTASPVLAPEPLADSLASAAARSCGGLRALMHRVERLEMDHLITLQCLFIFYSAQNGQINGVVVFRARPLRAIEDNLLDGDIVHAKRIPALRIGASLRSDRRS
jgi:hypothetical protein